jgi:hypothetical protein
MELSESAEVMSYVIMIPSDPLVRGKRKTRGGEGKVDSRAEAIMKRG